MNFLLFVSLLFGQLIEQGERVELRIDNYSLTDSTLILNCFVENSTSTVHSVYLGQGWTTIPNLYNLTLLILENDTLPLHEAFPFPYIRSPKYEVIKPYSKKDITIKFDLRQLRKLEHVLRGPPYSPIGICSFQLVYYDRLLENNKKPIYKAYLNGKRVRRHTPVSDTLLSNIVYIDIGSFKNVLTNKK